MSYSPDDIKRLMRERLPAGVQTLIEWVGAAADQRGVSVYLVGGFVRDLLLGRPNVDLDFVVEGDAVQLVKALVAQHGGDSFFGAAQFFGTAKWLLSTGLIQSLGLRLIEDKDLSDGDVTIDFARARRETYHYPGALPTVDPTPVTIDDDLQRRDFSINALAIRIPDGELIDRFDGINDLLHTHTIRVLHDQSFIDDPTRIFRAARFEQRLGFRIASKTESLIPAALPIVNIVSGHRIQDELDRVFEEQEPEHPLIRLHELGILAIIHPEFQSDDWLCSAFRACRWLFQSLSLKRRPGYEYWLIFLYRVERLSLVVRRLGFHKTIYTDIEQIQHALEVLPTTRYVRSSELTHAIEPLSNPYAAWAIASNAVQRDYLKFFITFWRYTKPTLTGDYLLTLGLRQGPLIGTILRKLRDARLDDEISTVEEERALVHKWLDQGLFESDHN